MNGVSLLSYVVRSRGGKQRRRKDGFREVVMLENSLLLGIIKGEEVVYYTFFQLIRMIKNFDIAT